MAIIAVRFEPRSGARRGLLFLGLGLFAVVRVGSAARAPLFLADSPSYLRLDFVGQARRLWTVPLIFNMLGSNLAREAFQIALGVVAWSLLAAAVARSTRNPQIGLAASAVILLLGVVPMVTVWDATMMSESITISLIVLLVAGCLELKRRQTPWLITGLTVLACLWVFTRQENFYVYLVLLPGLIGLASWRLPRRRAAVTVVALLFIAGWAGYNMEVGQQRPPGDFVTLYNAAEITISRPSTAVFFEQHGMPAWPVTAALRVRPLDEAIVRLYATPAFDHWVMARFPSVFADYVIEHPQQALLVPAERLFAKVSLPIFYFYGSPPRLLPDYLTGLLWSMGSDLDLWFGLVVVVLLLVVCTLLRTGLRHGFSLVALLIVTAMMTVLSYDLATEDYGRLFAPVGVCLRLLLILTIALSGDALLRRRVSSPERASTGSGC